MLQGSKAMQKKSRHYALARYGMSGPPELWLKLDAGNNAIRAACSLRSRAIPNQNQDQKYTFFWIRSFIIYIILVLWKGAHHILSFFLPSPESCFSYRLPSYFFQHYYSWLSLLQHMETQRCIYHSVAAPWRENSWMSLRWQIKCVPNTVMILYTRTKLCNVAQAPQALPSVMRMAIHRTLRPLK